jgi:hypothetical protein
MGEKAYGKIIIEINKTLNNIIIVIKINNRIGSVYSATVGLKTPY